MSCKEYCANPILTTVMDCGVEIEVIKTCERCEYKRKLEYINRQVKRARSMTDYYNIGLFAEKNNIPFEHTAPEYIDSL